MTPDERRILRHFLAAIAYRTQKAVRGHPKWWGDFRAAKGVRTPHELLRHMRSVLGYARTHFTGGTYRATMAESFDAEIEQFHHMLELLGRNVDSDDLTDTTPDRLLQGPLSDTMTHVGQLSILRRLAGAPIPPENFIVADMSGDNLSSDQAEANSPDKVWYEAEEEPR
ncbi:MAG: hypothetical protein ACE5FJ_01590 [Gemmatimonadales bacterium]